MECLIICKAQITAEPVNRRHSPLSCAVYTYYYLVGRIVGCIQYIRFDGAPRSCYNDNECVERGIAVHYTLTRANDTPSDEDALWQMLFYAAQMAKDGVSDYHVAKSTPSVAPYVADWGLAGDAGIIARADQRVCGAVWVRAVPADSTSGYYPAATHKLAIAVHPDYHGRGIGTTLMHGIGMVADQARWCMSLSVRSDNPACRLYQRHGFVVEKTIINRVGTPSSLMVRHQAGCLHQTLSKEATHE